MIKSINAWALPGGLANEIDPVEAMRLAKAAGFDGIELGIGETGAFNMKTKQAECEQWRKAAKQIGIQIVSVATGQYWATPLTSLKAGVRKQAFNFSVAMIERAGWLKAGAVLIVPALVRAGFLPDSPEIPYDFAYKTSREQLKNLAKVAEKNRVAIGVENVWNGFLYSPLEMARFIDEIGSRWVGAYFDVGNPVVFGMPQDWIRILGKRIKRVHLKEYKRYLEVEVGGEKVIYQHTFPKNFEVPFGKGDVNWKEVKKALKQARYDGPATVEVLNFTNDKNLAKALSKQVDKVIF